MPKNLLFIISLIVILSSSYLVYAFNNGLMPFYQLNHKPSKKNELDIAINQAKFLYRLQKEKGAVSYNGSCLSNAVMPGWVVDIVHNPRIPSDDLAENQCSAYVEGSALHFVELDTNGNLVRAR